MILILTLICMVGYAQSEVEVFEPDLFSSLPNVRDVTLSSASDEMYFTAQSIKQDFSAIMVSHRNNNTWSNPEVAEFSGKYKDIEPFLSRDGLTLYFASNRPVKGREKEKSNYDIWKVVRENNGSKWGTPFNLGAPINTEAEEFYPSVANNGNLYFTAEKEEGLGKEDIFLATYVNGGYNNPIPLPAAVNSAGYDFNAFVSPDESYLIFTGYRRADGLGRGDLYISRKDNAGNWLPATHLDSGINSTGIDYCPFVHNGVLYFTSDRSSLQSSYDHSLSTTEFLIELAKIENGKSRIYSIQLPE